LIAPQFLQAICRIEKNIFSMLLMPFGQRSLALTKGLICAFTAEQLKGASSPINRYILKLEAELGADYADPPESSTKRTAASGVAGL
jgi:hypothetical protein